MQKKREYSCIPIIDTPLYNGQPAEVSIIGKFKISPMVSVQRCTTLTQKKCQLSGGQLPGYNSFSNFVIFPKIPKIKDFVIWSSSCTPFHTQGSFFFLGNICQIRYLFINFRKNRKPAYNACICHFRDHEGSLTLISKSLI